MSEAFTNTAETIAHLPIESLAEIWGMLSQADFSEGTSIPEALLFFLRVFPIEDGGPYAILEASPLLGESDSSPQTWDSSKTLHEITQWALRRIFRSVSQVQKRANDLYEKSYPSSCFRFLASGQNLLLSLPIRADIKGRP